MKCPECEAIVKSAHDKWGSHGEDLYKCPCCATMLTHRRSFGTFFLVVVFVVPILTIFLEFMLTMILQPVIENTRFADSNRFMGISIVASLAATFYIFNKFTKLVVHEGDENVN